MPVLGENAKLDLRVNFYNLFNQLNFIPLGPQNIGTIQLTPGPGGTGYQRDGKLVQTAPSHQAPITVPWGPRH